MSRLPQELYLYLSKYLIRDGKLRIMYNLHKALAWDINIGVFIKYLTESRFMTYAGSYDDFMITVFEETGIDDGVPFYYLKNNLHKKLFRTVWASIICRGESFNSAYGQGGRLIEYTNCIIVDNRELNENHTRRCKECHKDFNNMVNKLKKEILN